MASSRQHLSGVDSQTCSMLYQVLVPKSNDVLSLPVPGGFSLFAISFWFMAK